VAFRIAGLGSQRKPFDIPAGYLGAPPARASKVFKRGDMRSTRCIPKAGDELMMHPGGPPGWADACVRQAWAFTGAANFATTRQRSRHFFCGLRIRKQVFGVQGERHSGHPRSLDPGHSWHLQAEQPAWSPNPKVAFTSWADPNQTEVRTRTPRLVDGTNKPSHDDTCL
jgi:hypothetical protein